MSYCTVTLRNAFPPVLVLYGDNGRDASELSLRGESTAKWLLAAVLRMALAKISASKNGFLQNELANIEQRHYFSESTDCEYPVSVAKAVIGLNCN